MVRLVARVALTISTIVWLPFVSRTAWGQDGAVPAGSATESALSARGASAQLAEQAVIDRYEKILLSRPQLGTALDKLYEFYSRQGSIAEYCSELEKRAIESKDGNLFHLLGLIQLRSDLNEAAVASLRRSQSSSPKDAGVNVHLAIALTQAKQFDAALDSLKTAANAKPSATLAIEIIKQASQLARRVSSEATKEVFELLAAQFPSNSQVIEKLAPSFAEWDVEQARRLYTKLFDLTREPQRRLEIQIELARLTKRAGQPEQALAELEKLVGRVKPGSWMHTTLLQQIEQLTEDLHGADGLISRYESALLERPGDIEIMLRLAALLHGADRSEEGLNLLKRAHQLVPTHPEPLVLSIDLLEKSQKFTEAVELCKQLMELDPSNSDFIVRTGQLLLKDTSKSLGERSSEVERVWRRLLINHEQDATRMVQLAELFRAAGMQELAVTAYRDALRLNGARAEFYERFAEYLHDEGQNTEARDILLNAVEFAGNERQVLIRASELLNQWGFTEDAILTLETATKSQPQFADLIKLAQILVVEGSDEKALVTISKALSVAVNPKELNAAWDLQLSLLKRDVALTDRVAAIKLKLNEQDNAEVAQRTQPEQLVNSELLALMQLAAASPQDAAETARRAASIRPDSLRTEALSARMQREAGLSFREIDSLRRLAELDARNLPEYLQRVATLQMQQNQIDEALKTLDTIIQSPTANLLHYQMAWTFCLQAKLPARAIDYIRKATAAFSNDRAAWMTLAQRLTEPAHRTEAIEATWRALELSAEDSEQKEVIDRLWEMYRGDSSLSELVDRIAQFGVAEEREEQADKWTAWVLLESDQREPSIRFVKLVLDRANAPADLLEAAIALGLKYQEFETALALQKRLSRLSNSSKNQMRVGELMALNNDWPGARVAWASALRVSTNAATIISYAKELLARDRLQMVAELAELAVREHFDSWELLALGIHAYVETRQIPKAAMLAEILLAQNHRHDLPTSQPADSATPVENLKSRIATSMTAGDRLAWMEHAAVWQASLNAVDLNRAAYRTAQMNPRSSQAAAVRHLAIQRGASIRGVTGGLPAIECFGDARALAVLARFGKVSQRESGQQKVWSDYVNAAIESRNVDQLWDCVLVMEPLRSQAVTVGNGGAIEVRKDPMLARYSEVMDVLVDLSQAEALELAISEIITRRHLQYQMASRLRQIVPAMAKEELQRLERLVRAGRERGVKLAAAWCVTLAAELERVGRTSDAEQSLLSVLSDASEAADIERLATAALQINSLGDSVRWANEKVLLRAFELELKSGAISTELQVAIRSFVNIQESSPSDYFSFLNSMITAQATYVSQLAPASVVADSRFNTPRRASRNAGDQQSSKVRPDHSSLCSSTLSLLISLLQEDSGSQLMVQLAGTENEVKGSKPSEAAERAVRLFSMSIVQSGVGQLDPSLELLRKAFEQKVATEVVSLQEARVLVGLRRVDEAADVLAAIDPPNDLILREVELWKMELALRKADDREAIRAAKVLANLPLDMHDSREVANVLSRQPAGK